MAMKGYSAFPKAPALAEPHHQIILCHIQDTRCGGVGGGVLPLYREAVGVFYSPSQQSNPYIDVWIVLYITNDGDDGKNWAIQQIREWISLTTAMVLSTQQMWYETGKSKKFINSTRWFFTVCRKSYI